jgi:hypothetical protein
MVQEGKAKLLRSRIDQTKKVFIDQKVWNKQDIVFITDSLTLSIYYNERSAKAQGRNSWEEYMFEDVPAIVVRTLLNKFRNDALDSRAWIIERLYQKATEKN